MLFSSILRRSWFKMCFKLFLLCLAALPIVPCVRIHEKMSVDQLSDVFQVTHHSLVPDYDVVQFQIPRRNKRDTGRPEKLISNVFNGTVELWLNPGPGILASKKTPVYFARTKPDGVTIDYEEVPNAMEEVGDFFENFEKQASLFVNRNSKGQYLIDGFIGSENLIVRSLSEPLSNEIEQNDESYGGKGWKNSKHEKSAYHVVFKGREKVNEQKRHLALVTDQASKMLGGNFQSHNGNALQQIKYLFPEVMVVADYDLFLLHGSNLQKILRYLVVFWNGVDLMYRNFQDPAIRFNIARIVIAMDMDATPFLKSNMMANGIVEYLSAWRDAETFFYKQLWKFPSSSFDMIVTMTGRQLGKSDGSPSVIGVATPGGTCAVYDNYKTVKGVGIVMDDGTFNHLLTAAHETGHLFSSFHDGDNNSCIADAGYIMDPILRVNVNFDDFSNCSISSFANFFNSNQISCMYNEPLNIEPIVRVLPGEFLSRDEQCLKLKLGHNCYDSSLGHDPCGAIYCYLLTEPYPCVNTTMAAPHDGAPCGDGKICLHTACVDV